MLQGAISHFKRDINRLFGTCVDILNVARSLRQLSFSMQILANNGVVQAARLGGGKGRPMLALAEILSGQPKEIRPEVQHLEEICANLAQLTAKSSGIMWCYHQLVGSLLTAVMREAGASRAAEIASLTGLSLTQPSDIVRLMHHPLFGEVEGVARDNRLYVAQRCIANLEELTARLTESMRCMSETERALAGIKTIGMTARYMAFCIATEAAALGQGESNFHSLASEIGAVIDDLDAKTKAMKEAIDQGRDLLELLLKGQTSEQ